MAKKQQRKGLNNIKKVIDDSENNLTNIENEENEDEKIDRFRRAILNSKKTITQNNKAIKSAFREWSEFIIGGVVVAISAIFIWIGINYFTQKKDISQITGGEIKIEETSIEPNNIKAYKELIEKEKTKESDTNITNSAVSQYKEEIATLQALTVTEASVIIPTASTGAKVMGKYYVLQVSTYRDINRAKKDVEYMKTRGFEAYYMSEDKKLYRVILNIIFTTMEEAEKFGENMKKQEYIKGFNVKVMENKFTEEVKEEKKTVTKDEKKKTK